MESRLQTWLEKAKKNAGWLIVYLVIYIPVMFLFRWLLGIP